MFYGDTDKIIFRDGQSQIKIRGRGGRTRAGTKTGRRDGDAGTGYAAKERCMGVFDDGALSREATVANFATVQKESGRGVTRQMEYFNHLSKKPKKNLKSIERVK